ncbi:MAG TPA: glutathione binding-like protein [Kofleriaceae bacterium]|nr:glutathione binding-like protein [Kofleriaceae bacterium]
MIEAYAWTTPNGYKLLIALEELGIPYDLRWINIGKGEQKTPEYLAINPNNKIPAIRDPEGPDGKPLSVFESGAVLLYLADKVGKLVPTDARDRYVVLEWLFFNAGGPGPMLGQLGYHKIFGPEPRDERDIERLTKEAQRLFGVLERRLGESRYLGGNELTIADIMNFTWPRAGVQMLGLDVSAFPNLKRWLDELEQRPAVKRALALKPPAS